MSRSSKYGAGLLVVTFAAVLLAGNDTVYFTWAYVLEMRVWETKGQYYFRLMEYHRHEKDRARAELYEDKFAQCGIDALRILTDDLRLKAQCGSPYRGNHRVFRIMGTEAQEHLHREIASLNKNGSDSDLNCRKQKFRLRTALIASFGDLSSLNNWLTDAQTILTSSSSSSDYQQLWVVESTLQELLPRDTPSIAAPDREHVINRQFIKWWNQQSKNNYMGTSIESPQ